MTRIAHCSCGSLRAEATGEPALLGDASLAQFAKPVLPASGLTCALHGSALPEIVGRLERSAVADHAVAEYAVANDRQYFAALP